MSSSPFFWTAQQNFELRQASMGILSLCEFGHFTSRKPYGSSALGSYTHPSGVALKNDDLLKCVCHFHKQIAHCDHWCVEISHIPALHLPRDQYPTA